MLVWILILSSWILFGIDAEDYEVIPRKVLGSEGLEGIPAILVLEGGYVVDKLGDNMLSFLKSWEKNQ